MNCTSLFAVAAVAASLLTTSTHAQGANATLLGTFDPSGVVYNDVWGYVGPTGKEYAILGSTTGTYIVDCSDPTNPVQRGFIPASASGWSSSTWRDIRTYQNYAYVVTEGGGGCQIIDLTDPDSPVLVKTWGRSLFNAAHNVAIDTDTGMMYPCGTNRGTLVVDLADPVNPVHIATYGNPYVHDLHVQDGMAHMGQISNGRYQIADVSNLPANPTNVGRLSISSCHNVWPSRDNQVAVTTSERSNGSLTVVDISNPRLPRQLATYRTGRQGTSIHNAYIRDRVAHMAYYSEGYRAVDISDPSSPRELAYYDTSTSTSGFSGNWGCYPFQPSGVIYASDFNNGLLVIGTSATTELYGTGTAGTGGVVPEIHTFGASYQGNPNFALELEGAAPNAPVVLLIGVGQTSLTIAGAQILVDPGQTLLVVDTATDASGNASVPLPVPNPTSTATLYAQWVVLDPNAPAGLAASQGLEFDVFVH